MRDTCERGKWGIRGLPGSGVGGSETEARGAEIKDGERGDSR